MFLNLCYSSAWLTGVACLLHLTYKFIRKYTYVTANCWFCNLNSKILFEEKNNWYCIHCKQFNGFNKHGDYSKPIPEQYSENPNIKYIRFTEPNRKYISKANGLCRICNANQELKIKQLASYEALNEKNYDEEIDCFKQKLEKSYKLCSICERTVQNTLKFKMNLFQSEIPLKTMDNVKHKLSIQQRKSSKSKYSLMICFVLLILLTWWCYHFRFINITERIQIMESFYKVFNNFDNLDLYMNQDSVFNITLATSMAIFMKKSLQITKAFVPVLFGIIVFIICHYLILILKIAGIIVLFVYSTFKFFKSKKMNRKVLHNRMKNAIMKKECDEYIRNDNTDISDFTSVKNPLVGKFSTLNLGFSEGPASNLKNTPYILKSTKTLIQPSKLKLDDSDNSDSHRSSPTISSGYESIANVFKKSDNVSEYDSVSQVGNNNNNSKGIFQDIQFKWRSNHSLDNRIPLVNYHFDNLWNHSNLITPYFRERPYLLDSNQYYGVSSVYSSTPSSFSSQAHEIQINSLCSSIQIILCSVAFFILGFSFQIFINKTWF